MNILSYKIIIVGDSSVGKSSILNYYINNSFHHSHNSTIGVDFRSKIIDVNNKNIKLQIWDTAGQERFRSIIRSYYRSCDGAIIVFDLTANKTLESIHSWLEELKNHNKINCPIILVGNKCDMCQNNISKTEIDKILDVNPNITYIEASAKNGLMINEIFVTLAQKLSVVSKTETNIANSFVLFDEIPNTLTRTRCYGNC